MGKRYGKGTCRSKAGSRTHSWLKIKPDLEVNPMKTFCVLCMAKSETHSAIKSDILILLHTNYFQQKISRICFIFSTFVFSKLCNLLIFSKIYKCFFSQFVSK